MTSKVDRLFGSRTRVALLRSLLMNPDRSFYLRELSRELEIPYGMLYKEEKNLVSLDILAEEKRGKITIVTLNKNLPYLSELKNLITKTAGLADLLKTSLSKLDIRFALVFGSFASGEESSKSDIDLLIIGIANEDEILTAISQAEKELKREINYIFWSEQEFAKRAKTEHHLLADIASRPVIMLVGEEDEFRRAAKKPNHNKDKT